MKKIFTFILILLSNASYGNAIDSIKTKKDAFTFLAKHMPYTIEVLFSEQAIANKWPMEYTHIGTDSFYIADIDKNGLNDLIIDGVEFRVILDMGNDSFQKHFLSIEDANYTYKGIRITPQQNLILVNVKKPKGNGTNTEYDTAIIYKDEHFVENVPNPSKYTIGKIEYSFFPGFCFDCNSYGMTILSDRSASYTSDQINHKKQRLDTVKASLILTQTEYQKITDLLNYMNLDKIGESYSSIATDQPWGNLTIYYDGGKVKKIEDYGLGGTLILRQFFDLLDELYEKKNWNKVIVKGPKLKDAYKDLPYDK